MRIAIDAHSIGSRAGGNETYFRELLRGLVLDQSDNQYIVFQAGAAALPEVAGDRRFSLVPIPKNPIVRMGITLPRLLRKFKPDVFHCQYVLPPFTRAKTVVTIHDLAHEHFPEFFPPLQGARMRRQVRSTAGRADHITTVSKYSAGDIERTYGVPSEKISIAYQAHQGGIGAFGFSPDGAALATAWGGEVITIFDAKDSRQIGAVPANGALILSLAFSSDGSLLVAGGGTPARFGELQFWDPGAGKLLLSPDGRQDVPHLSPIQHQGPQV